MLLSRREGLRSSRSARRKQDCSLHHRRCAAAPLRSAAGVRTSRAGRVLKHLTASSSLDGSEQFQEESDMDTFWCAEVAPRLGEDIILPPHPKKSEAVPLGASFWVSGGACLTALGPFRRSLQEWRSYRARLVALEQVDTLFLSCDPTPTNLWSQPSPYPAPSSSPRPNPNPFSPSPASTSSNAQTPRPSSTPAEDAKPTATPSTPSTSSSSPPPTSSKKHPSPAGTNSNRAKPAAPSSTSRGDAASSSGSSASAPGDSKKSPPPPAKKEQQQQQQRAGSGRQQRRGSSSPRAHSHHDWFSPVKPPGGKPPPPPPSSARPPRAPLLGAGPASWAHLLGHAEPGCLLLAQEAPHMAFFDRSVVLLTSHSSAKGSVGFVLNKPSPMKVAELQLVSACPGFSSSFGAERLLIGGPRHLDHATVLHRYMGLSGANEVADKLYAGGLLDAVRMVQAGLAAPQEFNLILGVSGWAPGQLADEIARGMWHCVSASSDLVLPRRAASSGAAAADSAAMAKEGQDMWARILAIAAGPGALPQQWM